MCIVTMRGLTAVKIRSNKPDRIAFLAAYRLPLRVVLDSVQRACSLGAIFPAMGAFRIPSGRSSRAGYVPILRGS